MRTLSPIHKSALLWLILLGPLFFISYGAVNAFTATRHDVRVIVYEWEHLIPFIPWTIFPYWSIDLFYACSLFISPSLLSLHRLGQRLLLAQVLCITGFLITPLQFSFIRSDATGISGKLFDTLMSFDKPFNQAPSLHICLLLILWEHYGAVIPTRWKGLLNTWFFLIGISVLTTYQHHFIDVISGIWAGCLCLFFIPPHNDRYKVPRHIPSDVLQNDSRYLKLSLGYFALAFVGAFTAYKLGCSLLGLLLAWIATSLMCISFIYLKRNPYYFGKQQGTLALWNHYLLAPYLLGAKINAWTWTHNLAPSLEIYPHLHLGALPHSTNNLRLATPTLLIDLCPEKLFHTPSAAAIEIVDIPLLDLLPPSQIDLKTIATHIQQGLSQRKTIIVCCALGFSRSSSGIAAWLILHQHFSAEAAMKHIQSIKKQVVFSKATRLQLEQLAQEKI